MHAQEIYLCCIVVSVFIYSNTWYILWIHYRNSYPRAACTIAWSMHGCTEWYITLYMHISTRPNIDTSIFHFICAHWVWVWIPPACHTCIYLVCISRFTNTDTYKYTQTPEGSTEWCPAVAIDTRHHRQHHLNSLLSIYIEPLLPTPMQQGQINPFGTGWKVSAKWEGCIHA